MRSVYKTWKIKWVSEWILELEQAHVRKAELGQYSLWALSFCWFRSLVWFGSKAHNYKEEKRVELLQSKIKMYSLVWFSCFKAHLFANLLYILYNIFLFPINILPHAESGAGLSFYLWSILWRLTIQKRNGCYLSLICLFPVQHNMNIVRYLN